VKTQEFQRSIVRTIAQVPQVVGNIRTLQTLRHDSVQVAASGSDARLSLAAVEPAENPALDAWRVAAG
jgi:hypothetical protein